MGEDLADIELALNRIRRSQTRRSLARRAEAGGQRLPVDHAVLGVLDAVDQGPVAGGSEVSVREVADRLGIDPSRASRLTAMATDAGLLRRVASQADGRRTGLVVTDEGAGVVAAAHMLRRQFYDELMRDWPARDRTEFARLLLRFTESLEPTE